MATAEHGTGLAPPKAVTAQFQTAEGEVTGPPLLLPPTTTAAELAYLVNKFLNNEDTLPYSFHVGEHEIQNTVASDVPDISTENTLVVVYKPQAIFKVRPVTRCSGSLPGHAQPIVCVQFSPDGRRVVSGSGDTTARVWDVTTGTPASRLSGGHANWVLCASWSPCASRIATGCLSGVVCIWNPSASSRKAAGTESNDKEKEDHQLLYRLTGHKDAITAIAWSPQADHGDNNGGEDENVRKENVLLLASASRDATVRVWDAMAGKCLYTLSQHTRSVTSVKWTADRIYTGSQDTTVRAWDPQTGRQTHVFTGHAHWVNSLAHSTDYAMRVLSQVKSKTQTAKKTKDLLRSHLQRAIAPGVSQRLASASDDFTLFLWNTSIQTDCNSSGNGPQKVAPLARLTGHQAAVNAVCFSPTGGMLASASFDKSVRLWDAATGNMLHVFRGHVAAVYQLVFSADDRLLMSCSRDSTCKVWEIRTKKLKVDLPGHEDQVYAVDWAPTGDAACSASKDCTLRLWRA